MPNGVAPALSPARRKVTLLGLIAATYFMVAGGPYGLEDVVQNAGFLGGVVLLLTVPFLWSLPTALMVSELSSAIPEDGGYYVWVRRALGPFWGFQEAWLSLVASIFDMAIYPILFVKYLGFLGKYLIPGFVETEFNGTPGLLIGVGMIAVCVLVNLLTPRSVGRSLVLLALVMLVPFAVMTVQALLHPALPLVPVEPVEGGEAADKSVDYVLALLFVMWNYMGWDNAATFADEVEQPQRTYPLAMAGAVLLVTLTYVLPVWAVSHLGIAAADWDTGSWVIVAEKVGGNALAIAIGVGGMISAYGMFNSLVLSYSRLPVVLAENGFLPAVFTRRLSTGAPWVAILVLAVAWALTSRLGLKRVLALDVMLYGLSLILEFAALTMLRLREPNLVRPFRVPGGVVGTVLLAICPTLLIGRAIVNQAGIWVADKEDLLAPGWALLLGVVLALLGPIVYFPSRYFGKPKERLVATKYN